MFLFPWQKLPLDTAAIEVAIAQAEAQTSAEIRVVVERKNPQKQPLARAESLFGELEMEKTAARNGVLIYLSFKPRGVAVFGDIGIHQQLPPAFWQAACDKMTECCRQKDFSAALCAAVNAVAEPLAHYFPIQENDQNELPNEVVVR